MIAVRLFASALVYIDGFNYYEQSSTRQRLNHARKKKPNYFTQFFFFFLPSVSVTGYNGVQELDTRAPRGLPHFGLINHPGNMDVSEFYDHLPIFN